MFRILLIGLGILSLFVPQGLRAESFVLKSRPAEALDLSQHLLYLHQPNVAWETPVVPPREADFAPLQPQDLRSMHEGINWIAIELRNETSEAQELTLSWGDFYYPIEAFERRGDGTLTKLKGSAANTFETGFFSLHFSLEQEEKKTFWVRFQKDLPRNNLPVRLLALESFQYQRNIETALRSLFVGCTLTIFFYNLFYLINLKQRVYAIYCVYVFFLLILLLSQFSIPTLLGLGNEFFSRYRFYIGYSSYELALIACLAYSIEFLDFQRIHPRLTQKLQIYYPFTVLSYMVIFFAAPVYESIFAIKFVGFTFFITYISVSVAWKGSLATRLYAAGFVILLLGNFINLSATFGVIPVTLFTSWVAPGCAVIEMLSLSFALSEKIRFDQFNARETIEGLNKDLHDTNQKLGVSFRQLQHEVLSRNSMVEDLSHRGNNPLHAANLAIDKMKREISEAEQLVGELFGPEESQLEEARECLRSFQTNFSSIRDDITITQQSLYRMAEAIREIRLMSETEERVKEWISWKTVFEAIVQRLSENLSDLDMDRLKMSGSLESIPPIRVHGLVLVICLERLFRRLLKLNPQRTLLIQLGFEPMGSGSGLIHFHFGEAFFQDGETQELGAALSYVLSHQEVRLLVEAHRISLQVECAEKATDLGCEIRLKKI